MGLLVRLLWLFTLLHRHVPNYTLSYGVVMVLVQDTWFVRRSDSPVLTLWKLEYSLNEHGVAPTSLQEPNVGLFPIRASGPSRLLRLRQIYLPLVLNKTRPTPHHTAPHTKHKLCCFCMFLVFFPLSSLFFLSTRSVFFRTPRV